MINVCDPLLSPVVSPYFTLSSFTHLYPSLVLFFISPVFCTPASHCLGTFRDVLMFHYHFIYQFIFLFFPTFVPPSPLVRALILFGCLLFPITPLIYLALVSLMCCNTADCPPGVSQVYSLAQCALRTLQRSSRFLSFLFDLFNFFYPVWQCLKLLIHDP